MSGEDGGLPDSPAAAVRARRESRTRHRSPSGLREAARDDDSDEEYEPEEEEQYDSDLGADKDDDRVLRGRVRLHGAAKLPSGGCRSMTKGKETGGPFAFHAFVGFCFFGGGLGRFPMKRKTRRLMGA